MSAQQRKFRDLVRQVAPSWLVQTNGYRLMYCLGLMLDALMDAAWAALSLRFAGAYSLDSLALSALGVERRLRQGVFEQLDTESGLYSEAGARRYALRLRRWLAAFANRGSPYELLEQLRAFHEPEEALSYQVIYASGRRYTMYKDQGEWKVAWDDIPNTTMPRRWARYTVLMLGLPIYHLPSVPDELRQRVLADLRALVEDFNGAHCNGRIVVSPTQRAGLWAEVPAPPSQPHLGSTMTWAYDASIDPESTDDLWAVRPEHAPVVIDFGAEHGA